MLFEKGVAGFATGHLTLEEELWPESLPRLRSEDTRQFSCDNVPHARLIASTRDAELLHSMLN